MNGQQETPAESSFGARLRELRLARSMSQTALSRLVHYSKGYLSKVENGRKPATADFARRCDEALGADGALMGMVQPPSRRRRRAPGLRPAQLPAGVTGFTGRRSELIRLDALVNTGRSVGDPGVAGVMVLSGTAGVGKTALAIHWARRVSDRFPDGTLFADLHGFGPTAPMPPGEVLQGFLRALGVPPESIPPDEPGRAALLRTMADGRRMLVVLDNAADSAQVRPLLPGSGQCLVLVTSRSRLSGLVARDGAARLLVAPLPVQDAVALLQRTVGLDRAQADPAATAEIAQACACLPLALRIAGERAAARPLLRLNALAGQLRTERDRLDLLAIDEDRETTAVRPVLTWSYQALTAGAARMLRLLSLHRGPDISPPAAGALADADEGGTQSLLDELCGVHLLEEFRPGRYRLHDLLRVYASERAHADETSESQTAARKRMLAWYLYTAEAASQMLLPQRPSMRLDPPPPGCRPLHLADYEDALAWCTAERINLAAAVDDAALCGENGTGWRLAVTLSVFYMLTKHWTDWLATNRTGLICARRAGERDGEAQVLSSLGSALGDTGRVDEAVVYLEQALAIRQELGDRISAARILLNLGVACWELELVEKGLQRLHQALSIFEETGDAYGEGMTLNNLGDAYLGLERFEESQHYLRRALTVFRAGGNQFGESMTLTNLGTAHRRTGHLEQAERYLRQALVVRQQTANRHGEAITLRELGNALADAGRMAEAQESRAAALAIFEELGSQEADQMRQPLPTTMTSTRAG